MKRAVVVVLMVAVAACTRKEPEPVGQAPVAAATTAAPAPAAAAAPAAAPAHAVAWDAPSAWTKIDNPSPMRKATYKVSPDAELTVTEAGGDPSSNVKRWEGQFGGSAAKLEDRHPNGLDVKLVAITGSYAGMGDPAPKPDQGLLGAIVTPADPSGASTFFKLVGPKATVLAARGDFEKLVASLRRP